MPLECKGLCRRDPGLVDCETLVIYTGEKKEISELLGFEPDEGHGVSNKVVRHYNVCWRFCRKCDRFLTDAILDGTRCKCCGGLTRAKSRDYKPRSKSRGIST